MTTTKNSFVDMLNQEVESRGQPVQDSSNIKQQASDIIARMEARKASNALAKETSVGLEQKGVPQETVSFSDNVLGKFRKTADVLGKFTGAKAAGEFGGKVIKEGIDLAGDIIRGENTPTIQDPQAEFLRGVGGATQIATLGGIGGAASTASTLGSLSLQGAKIGAIGGAVEGGAEALARTGELSEVPKGVAIGATMGGAIGASLPPLAAGTSQLIKNASATIQRTFQKSARLQKANNDIFRAIKPGLTKKRNIRATKDKMALAVQTVADNDLIPTTVKEFADNIDTTKRIIWDEIQSKIDASDAQINFRVIADQVAEMADDSALAKVSPEASKKLKSIAEALVSDGDMIGVQEAERVKQLLNAELDGAFGQMNLSKHEQNAKKLITKEIGKQLDETLSKVPGEFQDLKNKYGALSDIEDDVLKRVIVFERANPQGFLEGGSKILGFGNVIKGLASWSPSDILKGGAEIAFGQIQKHANDADLLIERAFKEITSPKNPLFGSVKKKGAVQIDEIVPGAKFLDKTDDLEGSLSDLKKELSTIRQRENVVTSEKAIKELTEKTPFIDASEVAEFYPGKYK